MILSFVSRMTAHTLTAPYRRPGFGSTIQMISSCVRYTFGKCLAIHRQSIGKRCASDWQAIGKRLACLRHHCSQHFSTISAPAALAQSAQVQADQRIATLHESEQGQPGPRFFAGAEIM
jgi:hypothetical protein